MDVSADSAWVYWGRPDGATTVDVSRGPALTHRSEGATRDALLELPAVLDATAELATIA